jgi:hypothetical protein
MKHKKLLIILTCFILIIFLVGLYKYQTITNPKKIYPTIELKETNFVNLKLISHKYAPGRVSIAIDRDKNILYAAYLDTNKIDAFQINDLIRLNKIDSFKVPLHDNEVPHILDLHFSEKKLLISIVKMKDEHECTTTELVELDPQKKIFKKIFVSTPCLFGKNLWNGINGKLASSSLSYFFVGGNMFQEFGDNSFPRADVCCTMGKSYTQLLNESNFYGWIISINKQTLQVDKLSKGHRKGSGLFFDDFENKLFEVENGPRGGDEINIISSGRNYGWPNVSYGRYYNKSELLSPSSFKTEYNNHHNYEKPIFFFTPSIGIEGVIRLPSKSKITDYWSNNLIVGSLKDKSIYRIILDKNKVISSERIYIGHRIRDIDMGLDFLALSTDNGHIILIKKNLNEPEGPFPSFS